MLSAKSLQLCLTLLQPHALQPASLLCPWGSLGKNTGISCHFLLQIFPTQGSNLHLLVSPALASRFFTASATWEAQIGPTVNPIRVFFLMYLWPRWGFTGVSGLSRVAVIRGYSLVMVQGLLLAAASLIVEHGLQVLGLQQLQHVGSVVVTQGSSCPAILLFLLCWQVDSLPLSHQERPSQLGFTLSDLSVQQLPSLPQKLGRQTRNCSFSAMLLHVPHSHTAVTDK